MAVTSIPRNKSLPSVYEVPSITVESREVLHTKPYKLCGQENEILIINIAGKRFETYLSTLERFPKTLLGDPEKRNHFFNRSTGEYFFDRNRQAFNGILYFYQSNGMLEKPNGISETIFTQEVIFFEMAESASECKTTSSSDSKSNSLELPKNKYLAKLWLTFEKPSSSLFAQILAVLSVLIILLSIVIFCLETVPHLNPDTEEGKHMKRTWMILNSVCNIWFTIEYCIRFCSSPNKMVFIRSTLNIVDLLSILPYYFNVILGASEGGNKIAVLRVIRVIRVIRIFKLTRHSRGLHILANTVKASSKELAMLMLFLAIGVILFSSAAYFAESQKSGSKFKSIPHGFWWAVVTMTTVGYGDLYPETFVGKLIGTLCAISGVLVIALPVPVIVSNFEHYYKEEQGRQARENEMKKKEKLDQSLPTIRSSMKMMTETSIILAGGKRKVSRENNGIPKQTLKDRFRAKISFSLQQPLPSNDYGDNNSNEVHEVNGNSPLLLNKPASTKITYSSTMNKSCYTRHETISEECNI